MKNWDGTKAKKKEKEIEKNEKNWERMTTKKLKKNENILVEAWTNFFYSSEKNLNRGRKRRRKRRERMSFSNSIYFVHFGFL